MSLYVNDVSEDDLLLGASASPTTGEVPSSNASDSAAPNDDYSEFGHCSRCLVGQSGDDPSNNVEAMSVVETTNYVGLVNQAMTCYLNSLVQALYMTPEFRNAIYNWEFDGQNEARSIPYQLQKLFLNLQVLYLIILSVITFLNEKLLQNCFFFCYNRHLRGQLSRPQT